MTTESLHMLLEIASLTDTASLTDLDFLSRRLQDVPVLTRFGDDSPELVDDMYQWDLQDHP